MKYTCNPEGLDVNRSEWTNVVYAEKVKLAVSCASSWQ